MLDFNLKINAMMNNNTATKNWFRILSPCILAAALTVIGVIASIIALPRTEGFTIVSIIVLVPFCGAFLLVDFITKLLIKQNTLVLWLVQLAIIAAMIAIFYSF